MLTPELLEDAGYNPQVISGFAFGLGLERLAMLKYGIDDIRKLWQPPYVPG
jgi:phenylalanyl-tRNA synthetase alpha chain